MSSMPPLFDLGTATFTASSDVVTFGGGANLIAWGVQPYYTIRNSIGQTATILEVTDATSLKLTRPFAGTAQTNQSYEIWPTPKPIELAGLARNVMLNLGRPSMLALASDLTSPENLLAFAALALGANNGLHVDNTGALAIHSMSAFGRALDGLSGTNGSFIRATGANTAVMQAIVAAVSQSGGVPTGGIVERGSNGNGMYCRFAGGLQVCWDGSGVSLSFLSATILGATWTFPAAFVGAPSVVHTIGQGGGGDAAPAMVNRFSPGTASSGGASVSLRAYTTGANWVSGDFVLTRPIAVGVWHS